MLKIENNTFIQIQLRKLNNPTLYYLKVGEGVKSEELICLILHSTPIEMVKLDLEALNLLLQGKFVFFNVKYRPRSVIKTGIRPKEHNAGLSHIPNNNLTDRICTSRLRAANDSFSKPPKHE